MSEPNRQKQIEEMTNQYESLIREPFEKQEKNLKEVVDRIEFDYKKTQILFAMIESETRGKKNKLKPQKNGDPYFLAKHLLEVKGDTLILSYALLNLSRVNAFMIETAFKTEFGSGLHLTRAIESRIDSLSSDISTLKQKKLIELKVPKKVERTLKEWTRQMEASVKASKQYVG